MVNEKSRTTILCCCCRVEVPKDEMFRCSCGCGNRYCMLCTITCDLSCHREVCKLPEGLSAEVHAEEG